MLISCTSSLLSGTLTVLDNAVAALKVAKTVLSFILTGLKVNVNHIMAFWSQGRDISEGDTGVGGGASTPKGPISF